MKTKIYMGLITIGICCCLFTIIREKINLPKLHSPETNCIIQLCKIEILILSLEVTAYS